jgi:hypothetical protein
MKPLAVALVAVAALAAGCGSTTNVSPEKAKRLLIDSCVGQNLASLRDEPRGTAREDAVVRKTLLTLCTQAAREGVVAKDGTIADADAARIVSSRPDLADPICVPELKGELDRLRPAIRPFLDVKPFATRFCHYFITDNAFDLTTGLPKPGAFVHVLTRHPAFGAQLVYAALMAGYDPSTGYSRADYAVIARRLAFQSLKQGMIVATGPGPDDWRFDRARMRALADRIIAQLLAQGRIH